MRCLRTWTTYFVNFFLSVAFVTNSDEGSKLNDRIKLENLLQLISLCYISVVSSCLTTVCITVFAYSLVYELKLLY
jgi:hypothetical protein